MTTYYASGALWNTASNWGLTTGASDGAVPTSSDIAIFDANSISMAIDVNVDVLGIDLQAGFTNTLTQNSTRTMLIGTSGFSQAGGTFAGGDSQIRQYLGSFTLSGGTFTSTSDILRLERANYDTSTGSPTFNHNNGTVKFQGFIVTDYTMAVGTETYYNVIVHGGDASGWTLTGTMLIDNDLNLGQANYSSGFLDGGAVSLKGNLTMDNNGFSGGSTIVTLLGTTNQTITSNGNLTGVFPDLTINKSAGDIVLATDIYLGGDWIWITANALNQAGFILYFNVAYSAGAGTIKTTITAGGATYVAVTFDFNWGGSISITDTLTVTGAFTSDQAGGGGGNVQTGTLNLRGDIQLDTNGTKQSSGGNVSLNIDGTVDQTISGVGHFPASNTVLNKASGDLLLGNDLAPIPNGWDMTITQGTIKMVAWNLTIADLFTMNGGAVTSTTGIFQANRYDLQAGTFDPFEAKSVSSTNTNLFNDAVGMTFMPSGGDFTFSGGNHWNITQNFTEFPHLILNKCPTCGQTGQWYAQKVTNTSNKIGTGFIRGDLISDGFNTGGGSGTQTFDGTGAQNIIGDMIFGRIEFNKISGSVLFQNDLRFTSMKVIAGANFVDFGTSSARVGTSGVHLNAGDWVVTGLEFWNLELSIATSGNADMFNTVVLNNFIATQCSSIDGDFEVGGNLSYNDVSINGSATYLFNGSGDQTIFIAGTSNDGLNDNWDINKTMGVVKLLSDMISTDVDAHLHLISGILCTNGFDITVDDLTLDSGTTIQKVSPTVITVNGTTTNNGTIVDVAGCSTGVVV